MSSQGVVIPYVYTSWFFVLCIHDLVGIYQQMQPANCHWLLTVDLHQFININNAETKIALFCCCDSSYCSEKLEDLKNCGNYCDTWFSILVSHCLLPATCSSSTPTQRSIDSVVDLHYTLAFLLNTPPDTVNISMYIYIYKRTHPRTHMYIHAYIEINVYIKTYMHKYKHTCTHTNIYAYNRTNIHPYIRTCTYLHTYIYTYIHT